MLVDADILGERRKLYEWVLEPLYSVRGLGGWTIAPWKSSGHPSFRNLMVLR